MDPEDDLRVEHLEQRLEVAGAGGCQEGVDDPALLGRSVSPRARAPHPPPGTAGELACRVGAATGDLADLREGDAEHVVQDEGDALGGGEVLEHHQHRQPDRVGELGLLAPGSPRSSSLTIGSRCSSGSSRRAFRGAEHVEGDAADHRRQPGAQVLDLHRSRCGSAAARPPARRRRPRSGSSRASGRRPRAGGAGAPRTPGPEVCRRSRSVTSSRSDPSMQVTNQTRPM